MKKIPILYILLTVESVTLFYLYTLRNHNCQDIYGSYANACAAEAVGALQYPQAVSAVALTLMATILLLAAQTIPAPKKKKKPRKK